MRRFAAAEREEIRRQEAKMLENIEKLPPERQLIARTVARGRRLAALRKAKMPEVGLFFMVGRKPFVASLPWTEVPSVAGFRTHSVDHYEYWRRLQEVGGVPRFGIRRGSSRARELRGRGPQVHPVCRQVHHQEQAVGGHIAARGKNCIPGVRVVGARALAARPIVAHLPLCRLRGYCAAPANGPLRRL